mmetsp:Transcript_32563/g.29420  ORF Transcript_32563/g.29420 Transcript_32563/m.29420 type:complete len:80 (-) Transcript_32563:501-740(-)
MLNDAFNALKNIEHFILDLNDNQNVSSETVAQIIDSIFKKNKKLVTFKLLLNNTNINDSSFKMMPNLIQQADALNELEI